MNFDLWLYPILLIGGFFTGLVNSISGGGGGLISLPLLLSVGLPPHIAIGTNKLQASLGSFTSSNYHISKKIVNVKKIKIGIIFSLLGSVTGSLIVQIISNKFLDFFLPLLLLVVLIFTLKSKNFGLNDSLQKISENYFYTIFGFALGFYDGFFGPGVGTFWVISFTFFLGFNFSKSVSHTSVLNFVSNLVALIVFLISGKVLFFHGLIMGIGQIFGSRIGAKMVVSRGAKFVKPLFVFMVLITILKTVWKYL